MKYILLFHICLLLKMPSVYAQDDKKLLYEGNKQYKANDFGNAEEKYRAAQSKNPNTIESYFNLGDALYKQGKYDDAAAQFNKVIQQATDQKTKASAYHNLGNTMLKANKLDESINAYKNALRNQPGAAETQYNLSYAQKKKKQQNQQQQKQDQEEKQDKKQDENKPQQGKDNPDENEQNEQNNPQQQPQTGMSKEEAERILQALKNKEQNLRKRMYDKGNQPGQSYEEKPW
ncbi:MAG: tetratricopeptide repeat protein [Bacteroidia bacterium]